MIQIPYPKKFEPIVEQKARYKVAKGGRGSARSHSFSQLAIERMYAEKIRVACLRETQNSISESVHHLLCKKIDQLGLKKFFEITEKSIRSWTGAEAFFKGLRMDIEAIKSYEDVDIAYIEEAETVSMRSLDLLKPTIRNPDSEIWINFNPEAEDSPVYQEFVVNKPDDCILVEMTWRDNPWFPEVLRKDMDRDRRNDFEKYLWVWEGQIKKYAADVIFKDKFCVEQFETPSDARFFYGADWGFSDDPTCLERMFIKDNKLWIDYEFYGHGIELTELKVGFLTVPDSMKWEIFGDCSRPDTISFMARQGFRITAAEKGTNTNSVEDGIQFLRAFDKIIIHPRCKGAINDFSNYRWKKDPKTDDVLPIPIDKSNHAVDACRYGLYRYIKQKVSGFDVL